MSRENEGNRNDVINVGEHFSGGERGRISSSLTEFLKFTEQVLVHKPKLGYFTTLSRSVTSLLPSVEGLDTRGRVKGCRSEGLGLRDRKRL